MSEQTVSAQAVAEPAKKVNLMNLTRAQMREFFAELGEKPFRFHPHSVCEQQQGTPH